MFFQISHPSKIQVTTTKSTKPKPTKIHKPSLKIEECIHHSGSLTSSNHGGQGANSSDGLREIGLFPPVIELVNDGEAFPESRGRSEELGLGHRGVVGMVANGGLGLGEPVASDDGSLGGSSLVVGRDFGIRDRVEGIGSGHEGGVGLGRGKC